VLSSSRSAREDRSSTPRPIVVAEAMVQELLVCLIQVRTEERKRLVMDEVDDIDAMQQLRDHVAVDMELVGCGALGLARCNTSKLTL
jgi:hypothetical protein